MGGQGDRRPHDPGLVFVHFLTLRLLALPLSEFMNAALDFAWVCVGNLININFKRTPQFCILLNYLLTVLTYRET